MEEEKRGPEVAPLSFPDLSLALPYQDALHYAQSRLKMIARGGLLPFCEAHKFPYTTIINLKNGNLKKEEPWPPSRLRWLISNRLIEAAYHPVLRFLDKKLRLVVRFNKRTTSLKSEITLRDWYLLTAAEADFN
jgi:hypothetical protein